MESEERERVQKAFVESRLEAVVATIAFGMGIDKPNVRTIIRTACPPAWKPTTRRSAVPAATGFPAAPF